MAPFQSGRGWQEGQPPAPLGVFGGGILYQAGQRAVVQNPDGSCAGGSLLEGTCRALCPLCGHRPLPASGGLSFSGGTWLWWPQAWLAPLGTEPFLSSKGIFCPSSIPWEWGFGAVFPLQELSWALSRRCVPPWWHLARPRPRAGPSHAPAGPARTGPSSEDAGGAGHLLSFPRWHRGTVGSWHVTKAVLAVVNV